MITTKKKEFPSLENCEWNPLIIWLPWLETSKLDDIEKNMTSSGICNMLIISLVSLHLDVSNDIIYCYSSAGYGTFDTAVDVCQCLEGHVVGIENDIENQAISSTLLGDMSYKASLLPLSWVYLQNTQKTLKGVTSGCSTFINVLPIQARSVYIPSFRFSFFYFMIENRKRVPKYPFLFS